MTSSSREMLYSAVTAVVTRIEIQCDARKETLPKVTSSMNEIECLTVKAVTSSSN
jgi:hypothetical protein